VIGAIIDTVAAAVKVIVGMAIICLFVWRVFVFTVLLLFYLLLLFFTLVYSEWTEWVPKPTYSI
jgi:hypothetical protein